MFGFQRIGDLIWAACDQRVRGFMLGATAGRTSLAGEGLQHQDGQSHLFATAYPSVKAYDPAFAYETTVIVMDGLKRMYQDQEDWIYYITLTNDNYAMPAMPAGVEEGIVRGIYKFSSRDAGESKLHVQLFGSGAILNEVIRAQKILAEQYNVASNVWSVTSYKELWRDAQGCERWNMLHPAESPRRSYLEQKLEGIEGPFIAASDNVRGVPQLVDAWIPGGLYVLGTDGYGRSDDRAPLRRFFEVDAESIVIATLYRLAQLGKVERSVAAKAIADLGVDPEKPNPIRY
jgi:pyruvate dehydrogenase E1 component